jgi:hypothetical protein
MQQLRKPDKAASQGIMGAFYMEFVGDPKKEKDVSANVLLEKHFMSNYITHRQAENQGPSPPRVRFGEVESDRLSSRAVA